MTLDEALTKLRAATPLLDRYGVARVGVFGSTARGEAGPDSDVDVPVEFDPARVPGWEYFTLGDELALVMERPVDVATPKSLPPPLDTDRRRAKRRLSWLSRCGSRCDLDDRDRAA